jgi:multidrug efflux pump subunit AcrB
VRFQRGFEEVFEAIRAHYRGLLQLCLQNRGKVMTAFFGFTLLSFALAPYLGQDFFPSIDGGQIKIHVRAQTGTRIEETTRLCDLVGEAIHKIIPADELAGIVDNIGLSVSGINMAYNNSGTIGVEDADILITLKPNHAPTGRLPQGDARAAAAPVPGRLGRLLAGRHGKPDLEFRSARASRSAGGRQRLAGGPKIHQRAASEFLIS